MKEEEMKIIAEFMKRIIIDKEDPAKIKKQVIEFRKEYLEIHYGFKITNEEELKLLKIMLHAEPFS